MHPEWAQYERKTLENNAIETPVFLEKEARPNFLLNLSLPIATHILRCCIKDSRA